MVEKRRLIDRRKLPVVEQGNDHACEALAAGTRVQVDARGAVEKSTHVPDGTILVASSTANRRFVKLILTW
jgi:predicted NAD/FAD-binding protein